MTETGPGRDVERARVGCCLECRHARVVRSDRGTRYHLCDRALTDHRYPRYPRLPVLVCDGFDPEALGGES